ncbi:MAG TPA: galactokinase family protein [Candidatus Bathyarchaeia archaeon]|nr:galactokinase family protein [Candidatus Bathyarchaeia archaeon]
MNVEKDYQTYSAPGRVCLYGEHQDYLKLVVIPAAINLRTKISLRENNFKKIRIQSFELNKSDEFSLDRNLTLANNEFDYLRAIILALYGEGYTEDLPGYDIQISSEVPIGSGLSSSAALLVSWLTALDDQLGMGLTKMEIADLTFKAENQILKINCGIMDQYSSAIGGIFSLDCDGPPYTLKSFTSEFDSLVIGDSLVRRSANEPLTILKNRINEGMKKLDAKSDFNLKTITQEDLLSFRKLLTKDEYKRLFGVIKIRDLTDRASKELAKVRRNQDLNLLGTLLTEQQKMLNENLLVSIEKLNRLVNESIKAGALGAKLTGAGLGGCIVALAPGKEKEVAIAIEKAGGKATICSIDYEGSKKEHSK